MLGVSVLICLTPLSAPPTRLSSIITHNPLVILDIQLIPLTIPPFYKIKDKP